MHCFVIRFEFIVNSMERLVWIEQTILHTIVNLIEVLPHLILVPDPIAKITAIVGKHKVICISRYCFVPVKLQHIASTPASIFTMCLAVFLNFL